MPDYILEGPKPRGCMRSSCREAWLFRQDSEVRKTSSARRDPIGPFVKRTIAQTKRRDPAFDENAWIKTLSQASRGYSIYEMDGRIFRPRAGRRACARHSLHFSQSR